MLVASFFGGGGNVVQTLNVHYNAHSKFLKSMRMSWKVEGGCFHAGRSLWIVLGQMAANHLAVAICVIWFSFDCFLLIV